LIKNIKPYHPLNCFAVITIALSRLFTSVEVPEWCNPKAFSKLGIVFVQSLADLRLD